MSWMAYISIACTVISLCCCWVAICVRRANKIWKTITDDLVTLLKNGTLENEKVDLLLRELHDVAPQEYCARILFFRNPNRLFGPGIQALLEAGPLCGKLHSERWWNVYEKIYLTAPRPWREHVNYLMAGKHPHSLEAALTAYGYDIDAILYPDGETTKQAMQAACEEYDDAMAAQEIMNV